MQRRAAHAITWLLACICLELAGCDTGPAGKARPAAPSVPTFQDFGDFEVHFNAVRTDELTPGRGARLRHRAQRQPRAAQRLAAAQGFRRPHHAGRRHRQRERVQPERPAEEPGDATHHRWIVRLLIGEVGISGTEILVFDIDASPLDRPGKYAVQFKREFVAG